VHVVLCGLDAAGKATQSKMLAERFDGSGRSVVVLAFPRYATEVGKTILRHLKGEIVLQCEPDGVRAPEDALVFQSLMLMDKLDAASDIRSHLTAGRVVICDRWWQSALCFGAADGLNRAWLHRVHESLPQADVNIYIDVPPEEAIRRRPEARDRYEKNRELQTRVRENYGALWASPPRSGIWKTVDGVGTPAEVHERIWSVVKGVQSEIDEALRLKLPIFERVEELKTWLSSAPQLVYEAVRARKARAFDDIVKAGRACKDKTDFADNVDDIVETVRIELREIPDPTKETA
jgi:dTMP kinase